MKNSTNTDRFEAAADAVVAGDVDGLRALLLAAPSLVHQRSSREHHAMLLHYVGANGVEQERQRSPANAPEVARVLLASGAEPDARCDLYGGTTTLELLVSSQFPAEAGVQADLVEVLCRGGASAEGPDDDGSPLWTAITWGYTLAAERLARCGARIDNVVTAAVVGGLDAVKSYFSEDGRPLTPTRLRGERSFSHGRPCHLEHLVEYALIYAAHHGRTDVVEWLLKKAPDLSVKEPVYGGTASGMAAHAHPAAGRPKGNPHIVALIEQARRSRG